MNAIENRDQPQRQQADDHAAHQQFRQEGQRITVEALKQRVEVDLHGTSLSRSCGKGGLDPSPQPPPRSGEGEQEGLCLFSPSPFRGGGWGEGSSAPPNPHDIGLTLARALTSPVVLGSIQLRIKNGATPNS